MNPKVKQNTTLAPTPNNKSQNNGEPQKSNQTSNQTNHQLLDRFLNYVNEKNLTLYPAQEEAILELFEGKNVILNTPTGSGKSLVALALHFLSISKGRRSFYTCPIKALVNEKFRALCADFGPENVGIITGDGSVNKDAPIICCTAEILANMALREGATTRVDDVIMDEFHYYSDKQRGVAWQVPLLTLEYSRFLLMSATLGEMDFFSETLTNLTTLPTAIVHSTVRPVPLDFEYRETPIHETIQDLVTNGLVPIYLVNFSQREAADEAQNLLSVDFSTKDEKKKIHEALEGANFQSPYGQELKRLLRHGIGLHHAGLLPKYRALVERLTQQGLLKVISGTDTLGVGVNIPIRTVLLTKLCKYDGEKTGLLSVRDFHQISGRAGRRGFDTRGLVAVQAPAHVIENQRAKQKTDGDPKKLRKLVLKTPPPKGFVLWTKDHFHRLISSKPEPLVSRFQISHGMLLNVLSRGAKAHLAMKTLLRRCHEDPQNKKKLRQTAFELFRDLRQRNIVEVTSASAIRVHVDLQDDFSLNQTLSIYLLDTLPQLQKENYALDLLTLTEAILESPEPILRKQLDKLKTIKMAEMKAAGLEYEERIEELDKLEHPKPNREFIYSTFNVFAAHHPWIAIENIRPKSIAREMFENYFSFAEYVQEYGLQRIEGLLLRYLSDTYKALSQTVPDMAKTDEVQEIIVYFGNMVKNVDSSLIEDWSQQGRGQQLGGQQLGGQQLGSQQAGGAKASSGGPDSLVAASQGIDPQKTKWKKTDFILHARNHIHSFVRALSQKNYETALTFLTNQYLATDHLTNQLANHLTNHLPNQWTVKNLEEILSPYYDDHERICTDTSARYNHFTHFEFSENGTSSSDSNINANCKIEQTLVDPEGHNDWMLVFEVQNWESCAFAGEPANAHAEGDRNIGLVLITVAPRA